MSFLDREATVAPAGYNRWLVPPAALAVHLSIGQVYALSVFKVHARFDEAVDSAADNDKTHTAASKAVLATKQPTLAGKGGK